MDNPSSSISNSDPELVGAFAHNDVLAQSLPSPDHVATCTLSDNTPAVAWTAKGSTTTHGPAAYLLQLSALHQQYYCYCNEMHHIPGPANLMADQCS